jgi:hypothetical protein
MIINLNKLIEEEEFLKHLYSSCAEMSLEIIQILNTDTLFECIRVNLSMSFVL